MIEAIFLKKEENLVGFNVNGHAGYADEGEDIVCAAVTSAVEMTANAITEIIGDSPDIKVVDDTVRLLLPQGARKESELFLKTLALHLENLSYEYNRFIHFSYLEV